MGLKGTAIITKIIFLSITILIIFLSLQQALSDWKDLVEVITGEWGAKDNQFGIEYGDTNDVFSDQFYILSEGLLIVDDIINGRVKIYNNVGGLTKIVKCVKNEAGEWNEECRINGKYLQITQDGNLWVDLSDYQKPKYSLYSPNGKLLKTFAERPLELGIVKEKKLAPGQYKVTIKYPDKEWVIIGGGVCQGYVRDMNGNVYCTGDKEVIRYNDKGEEVAKLTMPEDKKEETPAKDPGVEPTIQVIEEYGSPVVAPNGDVYTWKRTPDKFYIIKWTWQ